MPTISLDLQNKSPHAIALVVEPWGRQYVLGPGRSFSVEIENATGASIPVDYEDARIVLWASGDSPERFRVSDEVGPLDTLGWGGTEPA